MPEIQKDQEVPEVKTKETQQTKVKKVAQEKVTIAAHIMAVLHDEPHKALTNAEIRKALEMRSSIGKKSELAKIYKALHATMQRLSAQKLVLFYKKGNANAYYRTPESD